MIRPQLATAVSEKVKRCPDENVMSSSRQQLSIELPSFIISILASINIPSNQQSGGKIYPSRENPKSISHQQLHDTRVLFAAENFPFSRKLVFGGKVFYHFWGSGKWLPLTLLSRIVFGGHQGNRVPSIRQRLVCT
jgi:hypothetical protein